MPHGTGAESPPGSEGSGQGTVGRLGIFERGEAEQRDGVRESRSWRLASLKSDLPLDFSNTGTNKCYFA